MSRRFAFAPSSVRSTTGSRQRLRSSASHRSGRIEPTRGGAMTDVTRDPDDLDALRAASDVLGIDALLTPAERETRDGVRAFVDAEIRPHIADWFDRGVFPAELAPALGRLGVLGMTLEGYGCRHAGAVEYGLAALELEAGDSGIRTFVSVQGSLAMGSIHRWGSEEQKQEWLPPMARGEVIGCFGLTEPD